MTATMPRTATATGASRAPGQPLRVIVADDHPLFRRGITRTIRRDPRFELVAEAVDGRDALTLIAALEPDVAVLDHRMPELSGVEVCAQLRLRPDPPRTAVLLLSAFEDRDIVASAVACGAAGYIGKTAAPADICEAIERVGRGGIAFTSTTVAGVDAALARRPRPVDDRDG
jgi:two-component system nitrate/nitrite response regulator NarL